MNSFENFVKQSVMKENLDEALISPFDTKESQEMISLNSTRKPGMAPLDKDGNEIDAVIMDQGGQALVYVDFTSGAYRITNIARNGSHRILFTRDGAQALKKYIS